MIINHKKLNQTPKKNYEIVLHAMHCGGGGHILATKPVPCIKDAS